MRKRTLLPSLLVLVVAAPVFAQSRRDARTGPASLARRCVARTRVIADRTVHRIAVRTHRSIQLINELLAEGSVDEARAEGSVEEARQVARRCIAANDETARHGITRIRRIVTACTDNLAQLEAPDEMIHIVRHAGEAARTAIQSALDRATRAIKELLRD